MALAREETGVLGDKAASEEVESENNELEDATASSAEIDNANVPATSTSEITVPTVEESEEESANEEENEKGIFFSTKQTVYLTIFHFR